jgi:hypothetical protein
MLPSWRWSYPALLLLATFLFLLPQVVFSSWLPSSFLWLLLSYWLPSSFSSTGSLLLLDSFLFLHPRYSSPAGYLIPPPA